MGMDIFDLYAKIDVNLASFESGIRTAEAKFEAFAGKMADISSKINSVGNTAFKAFGGAANAAVSGLEAVSSKINSIGNAAFSAFGGAANAAVSGLEAACLKINEIGNTAFKALGASAAAAGAGLGAGLKYVIDNGSAYEAQMSKVEAISGATLEQMAELSKMAAQLGRDTKFSSTEAGQAYEYMAMAGWNVDQMLSGVSGIMDLAAASGEDLASTSDIVTDALTAFGLKAEDSTHFADVLAAASTSANTNVAMMGETFKYAAPLAGALGFSIEDVAGAIGLMANSGIKGTQAGTSLRSIFTRLASPVKDSATALEKLGVKITDNSGKTRKLNDIIADLRKGFANLSETEQAEYASMIAGQEAMSGFLALMNAAPEDIDKVSNAIANADGKAKQMAETMLDNLPGAITLFNSSLQSLAVDHIYASIQDKLKNFVMDAKVLIDGLSAAFETNGWAGIGNKLYEYADEGLRLVGEKLPGSLNAASGLVDGIFSDIERLIGNNSGGVNRIITAGGKAIRKVFSGFTGLVSTAVRKFGGNIVEQIIRFKGDIFEAGINIIGSLASGIGSNADGITDAVFDTVGNIARAIERQAPKIGNAGKKLLNALLENFSEKLDPNEILSSIAGGLTNAFTNVKGLLSNNSGGINEIISAGGDALRSIFGGFVELISQGTGEFGGELLNQFLLLKGDIFGAGLDIVGSFAEGVGNNAEGLVETVTQIEDKISGKIDENLPKVTEAGKKIIKAFAKGIDPIELLNSIADGISNVFAGLEELFSKNSGGINGLLSTGGGVISRVFDSFSKLASTAAKKFGPELAIQFLNFKAEMFGAGLDLIGSFAEGVGDKSGRAAEAVMGIVRKISDKLGESLPKIAEGITKLLVSMSQEIDKEENKRALENAVDAIFDFIFGANGLTSADNVESISGIAINLLSALGNGLINNLGTIGESIGRVVNGIFDELEKKIEETDWKELGKKILSGIFDFSGGFNALGKRIGEALGLDDLTPMTEDLLGDNFIEFKNENVYDTDYTSELYRLFGLKTPEERKAIHKSSGGNFFRGTGGTFGTDKGTVEYQKSAMGRAADSIVNSVIIKSQTERLPPTEVNLNVDGERLARVVVDPVIKTIRERDKEVYLH